MRECFARKSGLTPRAVLEKHGSQIRAGRDTFHGRALDHRMDGSHVQPVVGLHEGVPCLRPLLRRGLGEADRSRCVGSEGAAALSERRHLGATVALGPRRGPFRETNARLLRIDGGCVRVGTRLERYARQALGADRTHSSSGLAVAHEAPASGATPCPVERPMACACLAWNDGRESALRQQTHSISPRHPLPRSVSELRAVVGSCRFVRVD